MRMWKTISLTLVFAFLTVVSLPTEPIGEDQHIWKPSAGLEGDFEADDEEDDLDDEIDEASNVSVPGFNNQAFKIHDSQPGVSLDAFTYNSSKHDQSWDYEAGTEGAHSNETRSEVVEKSEEEHYPSEYLRTSSRLEGPLESPQYVAPDTKTPVNEPMIYPETAYTVSYHQYPIRPPSDHESRLTYQPENRKSQPPQPQESPNNAYARPQENMANSYARRMHQIVEYWREEERQKKMYESQNTYRRPSDDDWIESWSPSSCTYDSAGRPANCAPLPSNDYNSYDAISMKAPLSSSLSDMASAKANAEEEKMEKNAFLQANPVRLSPLPWPVRDVDRLGDYSAHPACGQPPKWGVGQEGYSAWFYSQTDGRCLWFHYAGKDGNANRFYSRANCEALCILDQRDLCQNAQCGIPGSQCTLRGDQSCKANAKNQGKNPDTECPPDQPVCRARRALINPEYDTQLIPRECLMQVDSGGCVGTPVKNPQIRYHYDEFSNTCKIFYFYGCGGNSNRFESTHECMNHCAV